MNFIDAAPLGGTRRTSDGYLVTQARAVRTGIQLYEGWQMGMADKAMVRVYRPEDEVRSPASLQSFSHAPVTMGHPVEAVTADNWKDFAIGEVSTAAQWEDDHISLPLILKDAAAIAAIEAGTRELSAGYTSEIIIGDGVTPSGETYDAKQTNIRINHLAVVPRGRAGSTRIGDAADHWGVSPLPTQTSNPQEDIMSDALISVVLGDKAVNVPAAQAPAIEAFKDAAAKTLTDTISTKDAEITDLKKQIETKDGEIKAKDKALADATSPEALQDAAKSYAKTTEAGKKAGLSEEDMAKMDDAAIRRAVVAKHLGDAEAKAMTDAAIEGAFAFAAKGTSTPTNDAALGSGLRTQVADAGWGSVVSMKKEA